MNCFQRLAVLTLTAISLLGLSSCSSLSTMTKDEAIEKDKKDQVYDSHASLANNICGYLSIVCPKDASITKEQFEKTFGSNVGSNTGVEIAKLGGVMVASSWLFPTSLATQTHQLGAGWFFLGASLLLSPSVERKPYVLAFVPFEKAKTEEEARKYFIDKLSEAERKVIKANRLEILEDNGLTQFKVFDLEGSGISLPVKGKEICPLKEDGKHSCAFFAAAMHGGINAVKTEIPKWLPNGGKEVWRISHTLSIFSAEDVKISKVQAQDISVQVAKLLPNNFYVYVPPIESKEKDKDKPAFVMSNSKVYPFIYVEP